MSDFVLVQAVEAVRRIAARIGLDVVELRVLSNSGHMVLHLWPAPVVARVRRGGEAAVRRELEIVRYLAARGAPVLVPLPDGPHVEGGWVTSFWPFLDHRPADESHRQLAADALLRVHGAFVDYPGTLPDFDEKIASCHSLLLSALPALAEGDRNFLLSVHEKIREIPLDGMPIHGDAGLHNLLLTEAGPLWTDFEAACRGPRAWDFVALGVEDDPLTTAMRSFCVSVWCWEKADLPGKREAAEYHLKFLKQRSFVVYKQYIDVF